MMLRRYHTRKEPKPIKQVEDLTKYTVKELREKCKERGLTGYSKLSEAELIKLLEGGE